MKVRTGTTRRALLLATGILACVYAVHGDVLHVVDGMPARDAEQTAAALAELVKGGPDAVQSVCAMLKAPEEGGDAKVRYTLSGLSWYVTRPGAKAERRMVAAAFCKALAGAASAENSAFIMNRLQECGGDESIETLANYLADDTLVEPATAALLGIDAPSAGPHLLSALKNATGKRAVTLVLALGESRYRPAVAELYRLESSNDAALSNAILEALASIGANRRGLAALSKRLLSACDDQDAFRRAEAQARCLRYASRIAQEGAVRDAKRVAQDILDRAGKEQNAAMSAAALSTLADIAGDDAIAALRRAAGGDSLALSVAAIKRLQRMGSAKATDVLVSLLTAAPSHVQAACLEHLEASSDARIAGAVYRLLGSSPDADVQTAAVMASARWGRNALPGLLKRMREADANMAKVIKERILQIADPEDMPAVAAACSGASEEGQIALLDVLAVRRAVPAEEVVWTAATHASPEVRKAAFRALRESADPADMGRLIALWLGDTEEPVRAEAARALVHVGRGMEDPRLRTTGLLDGFDRRPASERQLILDVLPPLGGPDALAAVHRVAKAPGESADAAIRALAAWPDSEAADAMLNAAEATESLIHQVLLLRGFVRVMENDKGDVERQVVSFARAMELAPRDEEKNMLENLLSRNQPLKAQVETYRMSRDEQGFTTLFNGRDLTGWVGDTKGYVAEDGRLVCRPGGNLFTADRYSDFILRFEFKLTPGANNGLGIRSPLHGDPAYAGMELQILDDSAEKYNNLKPWQYHGSIYGLVPAKRGFLRPVGEWNVQEVTAIGPAIKVALNGETIVDADLSKLEQTPDIHDFSKHPGLHNKTGHLGFLGHGSVVEFRNIRIKEVKEGAVLPPDGFTALFNGKDLAGWKGLPASPHDNPIARAALSEEDRQRLQQAADDDMRAHWRAEDGVLVFDGKGRSLCTAKDYGDFELLVDWKILPQGDSGIYLRGSPQVQIWDPNQHKQGSGGLFNNRENPRDPLVIADHPIGEWNTFRIKMIGERVTVHLNGKLVTDNVVLENYWDRGQPIFPTGQLELQNHGNTLYFRNIFIREL